MNKRLIKAKQEHEKYLMSMGVHPDQLRQKKRINKPVYSPKVTTNNNTTEKKVFLEDTSAYKNTGTVKGILANIHNEPIHVQNKIKELQSRIMPLYNKGGLQLASKNEDLTTVGSRSRRG